MTVILLLILASIFGLLILAGVVVGIVYLVTGLHHATKPPRPPGTNDANWTRDQGREA
jgi:hypothetical protein